jgi:hypothetical protein
MLNDKKNSKIQGNVGLGKAIAYYTSIGSIVSIPITDSQPYDLIIDNGQLQKIQVKTTFCMSKGLYQVNLKQCGGSSKTYSTKLFEPKDSDILYVFSESGDQWIIPTNAIDARTALTLGNKWGQYKVM